MSLGYIICWDIAHLYHFKIVDVCRSNAMRKSINLVAHIEIGKNKWYIHPDAKYLEEQRIAVTRDLKLNLCFIYCIKGI